MSSDTAMKKHHGNVAEYRASEGKTITVPYRWEVVLFSEYILSLKVRRLVLLSHGEMNLCSLSGDNEGLGIKTPSG